MELEFDRNAEDIIAFNLYQMTHASVHRRDVLLDQLFIALLVVWLTGGFSGLVSGSFNPYVTGGSLTAGVVVFFLYPVLARHSIVGRLRRQLQQSGNETLFGPQRVMIVPEGLRASNKTGESRTSWAAVQQVAVGDKHLFLFTSAMHAIIIPGTAFKTDKAKQEFVRLVEGYRRAV